MIESTSLLARLEHAERMLKYYEERGQQHIAASEKEVRGYGFEPFMLQWEWRKPNPPVYYDAQQVEAAIIDALCHEGIPAWHGDAVSCVAQIVHAQHNLAEKYKAECVELKKRAEKAEQTAREWHDFYFEKKDK